MIIIKKISLLIFFSVIVISSCKKKDDTPKSPSVTTMAVTVAGSNTANGGGNITNAGTSPLLRAGLCYSSSNAMPTISDDTTLLIVSNTGSFTSMLTNLQSSTTYYVRAYATNSVGTGYGEVVQFTTGNAAPTVSNIVLAGDVEVNRELTASYTYNDSENDAESGSTFQWYVSNDGTGAGETAIPGATELTFVIQDAQVAKYIRLGITPKAATGTTVGTEEKSAFVGPVGEATTVTFTYNNTSVTYGIITSSTTGKKWLDRNLGAPNTPIAYDDFANYGDLFQWGRLADGHQLIIRSGLNDADMSPVNGTTSTIEPYQTSSADNPGHSLFIINKNSPNDWRIPQNNNLWQGVNGINNPCPTGWRIPTLAEWTAENLGNLVDAFAKLKLSLTSLRAGPNGNIFSSTTGAIYWASTIGTTNDTRSFRLSITTSTTPSEIFRNNGYAVRCIKD